MKSERLIRRLLELRLNERENYFKIGHPENFDGERSIRDLEWILNDDESQNEQRESDK